MPLTIFDLDETLIAADSDYEWGQFVVDKGLVDAEKYAKKNHDFYEQYKTGQLDIDEYLKFSCSVLTQHSIEDLHRFRSEFVAQRILPIILDKARDLVKKHREQGDTLLVITATIEFVTRPIVEEFGINTLIAPEPEIVSNSYTGRIVGVPSFAAGKVTRLKQWLADQQHTLQGSSFYSDSHNDLPLLRLVDNPVAVDPDPILRKQAKENHWPIISLRD
jgi:HAD superfamily hydrolase (TIGR01490 family)